MAEPDNPPSRLSDMPTWLLSQAAARAHRLLTEALAAAGSRGYHYRLLAALQEFGPASQISLARRTSIDGSDVVATIDDLAARGYVIRRRDPSDLRRNAINITPAGLRHFWRLDKSLERVQEQLLSPLSPVEQRAFVGMLRRLTETPDL
jgi:DNA-binding MarR family transcriptional regulator